MSFQKIYYSPYEGGAGHRHELALPAPFDLEEANCKAELAEMCAGDWHSNHDGWEGGWPRVFTLFVDKEGPAFARMEVGRELEPVFRANPA